MRWLERTGVVNFDEIRAELARSLDRAAAAAESIGADEFLILADGMVYVVRDRTLVTVLPEDNRHTRARSISRRSSIDA